MNALQYSNHILADNLFPYLQTEVETGAQVMGDDSRVHDSKLAAKAQEVLGIKRLELWSANSPDLNPIENASNILKNRPPKQIQRKKRNV